MSELPLAEFPVDGLLPKAETGAKEFMTKNPTFDGRGIIIAILDTGVDPAAVGLQETSDGKPKVIDIVDCTGSGDVVLKEENDVPFPAVEDAQEAVITGLSGKKLKLPKTWNVAQGTKLRRGIICLHDVYSRDLVNRLTEARKERFMQAHNALFAAEQRKFDDWKRCNPKIDTPALLITKKDFEDRLAALVDFDKAYNDAGPIVDFVVFSDAADADSYKAAFDLEGSGDLTTATLLADYATHRQHLTIDAESLLSFSVKFYDAGRVLSFVTHCGSHGTHVAAITAANVPSNAAACGVAPGAQIVSVKIGDTRLGSMETGIGVARAIKVIAEHGCHLVNMSYGEYATIANYGVFVTEMQRLAADRHVIFVSSAGNNGPCTTTVGTPGGTSECAIGVGAYVSQAMMRAEYALLERNGNMPYSWSSRGPTRDGDAGVHVFAPGGAVTSVPRSSWCPTVRMNGTSMSSPNACGAIALLLSAALQLKMPWTFARIKRIVTSTARSVGDPMGVGMLDVCSAFEAMLATRDYTPLDFQYKIAVSECEGGRGIYLRSHIDFSKGRFFNCNVTPVFSRDEASARKFGLECHLSLLASQPWIRVPDNLHFANKENAFSVFVDLPALEDGFNFGVITAYDPTCRHIPLFTVPVCVIKPRPVCDLSFDAAFGVKNGELQRFFLTVPNLASRCRIRVENRSDERGVDRVPTCVIQAQQVIAQQPIKSTAVTKFVQLAASATCDFVMAVAACETLEICAGLSWAAHGSAALKLTVDFDGVTSPSTGFVLAVAPSEEVARLDLISAARRKTYKPKITCTSLVKSLAPCTPGIVACPDERGLFAHNSSKLWDLTLTYRFKNDICDGDVEFSLGALDNSVYDGALVGVLMQIFDSATKKRIAVCDSYSRKLKALSKGSYEVRLRLVSTNQATLEALKGMNISAAFSSLPKLKDASVTFYASPQDAVRRSAKLDAVTVASTHTTPLFLQMPREFADGSVGDLLTFEVAFFDDKPANDLPASFTVNKALGAADPKPSDDVEKIEPPFESRFVTAVADLVGRKSTSATKQADFATLSKLLGDSFASSPAWLLCALNNCTEAADRIAACDRIIAAVNAKQILDFEAVRRTPIETIAVKAEAARIKEAKAALLEALSTKCRVLQAADVLDVAAFEAALKSLAAFVSVDDRPYVDVFAFDEERCGRLGSALNALNKCIAQGAACDVAYAPEFKALVDARIALLKKLQWTPWLEYQEAWRLRTFPADFAPF